MTGATKKLFLLCVKLTEIDKNKEKIILTYRQIRKNVINYS